MILFDHIKMGLILLVIFGIPVLFLIYVRKIDKSYYKRVIGDLPDEVKAQLIMLLLGRVAVWLLVFLLYFPALIHPIPLL